MQSNILGGRKHLKLPANVTKKYKTWLSFVIHFGKQHQTCHVSETESKRVSLMRLALDSSRIKDLKVELI